MSPTARAATFVVLIHGAPQIRGRRIARHAATWTSSRRRALRIAVRIDLRIALPWEYRKATVASGKSRSMRSCGGMGNNLPCVRVALSTTSMRHQRRPVVLVMRAGEGPLALFGNGADARRSSSSIGAPMGAVAVSTLDRSSPLRLRSPGRGSTATPSAFAGGPPTSWTRPVAAISFAV